jgi:hypothetical protein
MNQEWSNCSWVQHQKPKYRAIAVGIAADTNASRHHTSSPAKAVVN